MSSASASTGGPTGSPPSGRSTSRPCWWQARYLAPNSRPKKLRVGSRLFPVPFQPTSRCPTAAAATRRPRMAPAATPSMTAGRTIRATRSRTPSVATTRLWSWGTPARSPPAFQAMCRGPKGGRTRRPRPPPTQAELLAAQLDDRVATAEAAVDAAVRAVLNPDTTIDEVLHEIAEMQQLARDIKKITITNLPTSRRGPAVKKVAAAIASLETAIHTFDLRRAALEDGSRSYSHRSNRGGRGRGLLSSGSSSSIASSNRGHSAPERRRAASLSAWESEAIQRGVRALEGVGVWDPRSGRNKSFGTGGNAAPLGGGGLGRGAGRQRGWGAGADARSNQRPFGGTLEKGTTESSAARPTGWPTTWTTTTTFPFQSHGIVDPGCSLEGTRFASHSRPCPSSQETANSTSLGEILL